ncbi:MAG: hypothetical protein Tsb0010_04960 [Parvularculaceae bacterium]
MRKRIWIAAIAASLAGKGGFALPLQDAHLDPVPEANSPASPPAEAEENVAARPAMTAERLEEIILRLDANADIQDNVVQFTIADRPVYLVYDLNADRMRLMSLIVESSALPADELKRLLQANFDSALDARYALAQGALWSVFIHALSPLTDEEFIEGLGQTVNLVLSFGTTYSSGALIYGGGDSQELQRELIDDLLKRGRDI